MEIFSLIKILFFIDKENDSKCYKDYELTAFSNYESLIHVNKKHSLSVDEILFKKATDFKFTF